MHWAHWRSFPLSNALGSDPRWFAPDSAAISELGARGCILTGAPAYYSRFGFAASPESAPTGEPSEFFMVKLLCGQLPVGPILFHDAFGGAA
jgi:predicted N-acetyltransferase YhbS